MSTKYGTVILHVPKYMIHWYYHMSKNTVKAISVGVLIKGDD